jgi:hypothetical protein
MKLTKEQLGVLQHALGVDQYGQGEMYRNHYVGEDRECYALVEMGYMVERRASELTGGDPLFHVTESGRQAVRETSPKPPKLTRSQLRYREYLGADSGLSFREWLALQKHKAPLL